MGRAEAVCCVLLVGCAGPAPVPPGPPPAPAPVTRPPLSPVTSGETPNPAAQPLAPLAEPPGPPEPGAPSAALRLHRQRVDVGSGDRVAQGSGAPPEVAGPTVNLGPVLAPPGMSDAQRVVAALQAGFRRCYTRALHEDPNLSGAAALRFEVGRDGQVTAVAVNGKNGLSAALVTCLTGVAKGAQFSRPPGGSATLTVPMSITRQ